jgi:uncharacterized protein YdhG (YjbR/CyaY superfamily)
MASTGYKSVDEYLAAQPEALRAVLARVRGAIRKALPHAEEAISYQIPVYRQHGGYVVYFAGWKRHVSLYPAGERLVAAFRKELAPYELRKGTIRFPLSEPPPLPLIGRIARFLGKEAAARARAKRKVPRKPR